LRTTAALNDGTISARIETSNDNFKTIASTESIELRSGEGPTPVKRLTPARLARVTLTLATPATAERSPILTALELTAIPTRP